MHTTTVNLSVDQRISWNYETSNWNTQPVHGSIRLDINIEEIIRVLGSKALLSKSGKAVDLGGLVKATRISLAK